ncbi:MAG: hypothetical protein UR91_C0026G0006 [Candidatus Nomurabacteria bacterium GW2011_GWC2_35_8]|uniref:Uncharacterized protein n=1 Tax=Candidatus Nomurabacteria bacterium GW2011_GWC2_35_8 TaxID=1618752 RepID=A0A0G0G8U7_9BACT|nr:MAG: hypothetical protein UR91_C0026G0006 [Candidatus Nomurabacteria bacterium GW2011_GWC2_35_8]
MGNKFQKIEHIQERILQLEEVLKRGRSVAILIEKYQSRFEKLKNTLGSGESSLKTIIDNSKNIFLEIKQNQKTTTELLVEVNGIYEQAKTLLESKSKLEVDIAETRGVLDVSNKEIAERDQLGKEVLTRINELSELSASRFSEIEAKLREISTLETQYKEILVRLNDPESGIDANLSRSKKTRDDIGAVKDEASKLHANISLLRDDAIKYKESIVAAEKTSLLNRDKIEAYLNESEKQKVIISDIVGLVSDSSLAAAFKERKYELNKSVILWFIVLVVSVILVSIPLFWDYYKGNHTITSPSDWWILPLRLFVSSPLSLLAIFAGKQYSTERILQEKYAFKETTSRVHKSHVLFLLEKFPKNVDEIFFFTKNTVESILTIPFENKRTKIKFGVGSKWFGDFFNFNGEAEDIPALANEFLNKASKKKLPPNAVKNRSLKNKKPK